MRKLKGFFDDVVDADSAIKISAKLAIDQCSIGLVVGAENSGKTSAIKRYVYDNPDTAVIYASKQLPYGKTIRALAESIDVLQRGTIRDIYERICEKLKEGKKIIIIDDAEILQSKSLDVLRSLCDKTKCAMLLVGSDKLMQKVKSVNLEYLYSRTRFVCKIPGEIDMFDTIIIVVNRLREKYVKDGIVDKDEFETLAEYVKMVATCANIELLMKEFRK